MFSMLFKRDFTAEMKENAYVDFFMLTEKEELFWMISENGCPTIFATLP